MLNFFLYSSFFNLYFIIFAVYLQENLSQLSERLGYNN